MRGTNPRTLALTAPRGAALTAEGYALTNSFIATLPAHIVPMGFRKQPKTNVFCIPFE